MKKTLSLIFTVLFLAVCLVPGLGLLLTGGADAAANEILPAAPVIAADGDFNPDFLAETAAYVNGRFSFRLEGITAWAKLNAALFRTSTAENVLLGRDGWLFYAPTIHDYTGDAPMTARELYCAARTLYLLQEYAENRGGDFLFTAAPNKNTLYPEYMPARTRLGSVSDMDVLYALLDEMGVSYLDLRDIFSQEDEPLYFKTDSHWNAKGAALAADALLAAFGRESDYFPGTVSAGNTHRGDLYEMLYPAGKALEEDFAYAPGFSFTANTDNPDRVTITTENTIGKAEADEQIACTVPAAQKKTVVVISADHMGEGDEELGRILIKGFIFALTQQEHLPSTILFYNGGARLTCEDSASLEDLKNLASLGVEILTCGTCLNHYGLTDKLAVGDVTNMYVITEKQMQADLILRP